MVIYSLQGTSTSWSHFVLTISLCSGQESYCCGSCYCCCYCIFAPISKLRKLKLKASHILSCTLLSNSISSVCFRIRLKSWLSKLGPASSYVRGHTGMPKAPVHQRPSSHPTSQNNGNNHHRIDPCTFPTRKTIPRPFKKKAVVGSPSVLQEIL